MSVSGAGIDEFLSSNCAERRADEARAAGDVESHEREPDDHDQRRESQEPYALPVFVPETQGFRLGGLLTFDGRRSFRGARHSTFLFNSAGQIEAR